MKTYQGRVTSNGCQVIVTEVDAGGVITRTPLQPCFDIRNHSPDGFAWGYSGSGPAQLALALLVSALNDKERALRLYQMFKSEFVAKLEYGEPWEIVDRALVLAADRLDAVLARHKELQIGTKP